MPATIGQRFEWCRILWCFFAWWRVLWCRIPLDARVEPMLDRWLDMSGMVDWAFGLSESGIVEVSVGVEVPGIVGVLGGALSGVVGVSGVVGGTVCGMVVWPGAPGSRVMLVCASAPLAIIVAASARVSFITFLPWPVGQCISAPAAVAFLRLIDEPPSVETGWKAGSATSIIAQKGGARRCPATVRSWHWR